MKLINFDKWGGIMHITNLMVALFLAILGGIIRWGRASWLIAGYNTSPKEEKDKYDEKALCNFVGNLLFILASIYFFIAITKFLNFPDFKLIMLTGIALFIVIAISAVIYMNTGDRFKKK